jgi:hypothetical protein
MARTNASVAHDQNVSKDSIIGHPTVNDEYPFQFRRPFPVSRCPVGVAPAGKFQARAPSFGGLGAQADPMKCLGIEIYPPFEGDDPFVTASGRQNWRS